MGGGASDHRGEIGGRKIHLDVFGRKKDLMRLHLHGHAAAKVAARPAGDGRSHLGRCVREGPVKFLQAPAERGEHRGRVGGRLQPEPHAVHSFCVELMALFFEGGREHEWQTSLHARIQTAIQMPRL